MKSIEICTTCYLLLSLLFAGCAGDGLGEEISSQVEREDVIIGVSPFFPEGDATEVRNTIFRILLERAPRGSRVTVFDAHHLARITDLQIPAREAYDLLKVRAKHLESNLLAIDRFFTESAKEASDGTELDGRIRAPQFFDFVADSRLSDLSPATIVLFGGALYLAERDDRFSMADGLVPMDDHFCVEKAHSVFGLADREGQLRGARVHHAYFGEPWINDLHEAPVERFWSLFIEGQGGELRTFVADLPTVVDQIPNPVARSSRHQAPQRCPPLPKLGMFSLVPPDEGEQIWLTGPEVTIADAPPPTRRSSLKIGIRWSCAGCDLDLYSRPVEGADELYYQNPRTDDGVYFKDFHGAPVPVNGFEWIEYLEPVDLADVEAAVNFYGGQSPGGVTGEVRILVGESVYGGTFEIPASEGNRGVDADRRADSRYWTVLDVGELLHLGDDRSPTRQRMGAPKAQTPNAPAAARAEPSTDPSPEPRTTRDEPARGVRILVPKDGSEIHAPRGLPGVPKHPVSGEVFGFSQADIERLGLRVEAHIFTNQWYPQGICGVRPNGTWELPVAHFGGSRHVVRAVLMDRDGDEIHSHEITVTVVH